MRQSLNDDLSEVWRHERTAWVLGIARYDSRKVGSVQVRKDLRCHRGEGVAEQRHVHESDLDVWRAWWKERCHDIGAQEWGRLLRRPPISPSVCSTLYGPSTTPSCGALSHSRMQVHCDMKWRTFDMAQCLGEFGSGLHVTLLLNWSFLCFFVFPYLWLLSPLLTPFSSFLHPFFGVSHPSKWAPLLVLSPLPVLRKWWRKKLFCSSPTSWRFS